MFKYILLASYLNSEAVMNQQGARIAEHLQVKMDFTWENPGVTLTVEEPLTPIQVAIVTRHYGIEVIAL